MLALGLAAVAGLCLALGWYLDYGVLIGAAFGFSVLGLALVVAQGWRRWQYGSVTEDLVTSHSDDEQEVSTHHSEVPEEEVTAESSKSDGDLEEKGSLGLSASTDASGALVDRMSGCRLGADDLVYVLAGRKRFHAGACRLVGEEAAEELTLVEAQEEAFTPCTVCLTSQSVEVLT